MIKEWAKILGVSLVSGLMMPLPAFAHEAYVLSKDQWDGARSAEWFNIFDSLLVPANLGMAVGAVVLATIVFGLSIYFWRTSRGQALDKKLKKLDPYGHLIIRLTFAAALLIGVHRGAIFGPELSIDVLPAWPIIRYALYGLSILLAVGWMTELASLVIILVFLFMLWSFGTYGMTYIHYFAVAAALMVYGAGRYSVDHIFIHKPSRPPKHAMDTVVVRVGFGLALIIAAVTVKLLHPAITATLIDQFKMAEIGGLMPRDPNFLLLSTAMVELAIGLAILVGFQTRLMALAMIVFLSVAMIFFKEVVWPHLLFYGIAISLFLNNGGYMMADEWIEEELEERIGDK